MDQTVPAPQAAAVDAGPGVDGPDRRWASTVIGMMSSVYLDHASVWPLRPEARRAMDDARDLDLGDPDRLHGPGRRALDLLTSATASAAQDLGAGESSLVWTSGGTEAVHLAVLGTARAARLAGEDRRHVIVSAVEHSSVLRAAERLRDEHGFALDVVGVDRAGLVDPDEVAARLRSDTLAVHVQHANHEVGAVQPTFEISQLVRAAGAVLHVDACQSVGQLGVTLDQLGADLLSASSAKFGGPPGVGMLALARSTSMAPLLEGDHRQARRRAGLMDPAAIAGTAVALRVAVERQGDEHRSRELSRRWLRETLATTVTDVEIHGPLADAHPGIVAASALYVDGAALASGLDAAGFCVHSGSSCASTSGLPSHVLIAMEALTHGHVRVSIGPETTQADLAAFVDAYREAVDRLRTASRRPARS